LACLCETVLLPIQNISAGEDGCGRCIAREGQILQLFVLPMHPIVYLDLAWSESFLSRVVGGFCFGHFLSELSNERLH
jgi:hypothetical protein